VTEPVPGNNPADPHSHVLTTSQPCIVHKRHIPESRQNQRHHVYPLGEGGPNIEDNIIAVCPTGHMNIHLLLKEYKLYSGRVPYTVMRQYSLDERKYAELGYKRITRGSM
jgi:hypothetical protein